MNNGHLLDNIADIELPAPPDWHPAVLSAIIVIVLIMLIIAWHRHTPGLHRQAEAPPLQRLDRLQRQWQGGTIDDRETAYRLAAILRLGLKLRQLTDHCPGKLGAQHDTWAETIAHLQTLRYQPDHDGRLNSSSFTRIRDWLSQALDEEAR